jgi:hypothetical protein
MAMWFRTLFDTLLARSTRTWARKSRLAPSFRRRSRPARPLLEVLEDRTLLSTYVVDSLTDTGTGSGLTGDLRYCITNATSGSDTITFAQGLTGTINLESALPTLNASLALQGPGANLLTVAFAGNTPHSAFGIFDVTLPSVSMEISGLTIYGNAATAGVNNIFQKGAISNAGTLTVSACTFSEDANVGGYQIGGAGAIMNSGTAIVSNCSFNNCSGNGVSDDAGAIENSGTLTVGNSTFNSNSANYGGGAITNSGTATISSSTFNSNLCIYGGAGAITNSGVLTLNYSTLSGNRKDPNSPGYGGGANDAQGGAIANWGALTINNSTISGNDAKGGNSGATASGLSTGTGNGMGGGIYTSGGTLSINSSTIADNEAIGGSTAGLSYAGTASGGGLYIAGGSVSINNSTLADNQAISGAGTVPGTEYGGGIYNAAGPGALQMYDTILADNSAGTAGPDMEGGVTSLGHNLIGNSSGGSGFAASDLVNVNPQLGPLQNNGGPTQTMALLPGSPAIDAGDNTSAPAYDQRGPGFPRIVNGTIDIGAFEVQNGSPPQASSLAVSGFPSPIQAGASGSFMVTALYADGSTDTGYAGTVVFTSSDAQAALPAAYTFTAADAGRHTFSASLKTVGTRSITAADTRTASLSGTDGGITVGPAAASQLVVSGYPSPTTAGASHAFVVTAEDRYANVATGYTGTVYFTSSDARAGLPANYSFSASDAGVHTFSATLKTAGTQSITAADTAASSLTGTDGGIVVNPAAASKFVISAPPSVNPGAPFGLTVTVEDAYGNVVTGYAGTIHFSSTDKTATLPATYTFAAADKGVHTFTGLILRKKGRQSITITDTRNSLLTGSDVVDVL